MLEKNQKSLEEIKIEEKDKKIEVHDLYKLIGHSHRFQIKMMIYICLIIFSLAFILSFTSFAFKTPKFQCPLKYNGSEKM